MTVFRNDVGRRVGDAADGCMFSALFVFIEAFKIEGESQLATFSMVFTGSTILKH